MLTIAIPTYNRKDCLLSSLKVLLPQLTPDCHLLILDNCSDEPVENGVRSLLQQYPRVNGRIVRHPVNVGAGANLLRAFELCETEWLWIMGDDDEVALGGVEKVFSYLVRYPKCVFLNFNDGYRKAERTILTTGLYDFVDHIDCWPTIAFMSGGIYRAPMMRPHLRYGYRMMHTHYPQAAVLLSAIGGSGMCCLSHERVTGVHTKAPVESQLNPILLYMGCMSLIELPMDWRTSRLLAKRIRWSPPGVGIIPVWSRVFLMTRTDQETGRTVYQYDQICHRFFWDANCLEKIEMALLRLSFLMPRFFNIVYDWLRWVARKKPVVMFDIKDCRS